MSGSVTLRGFQEQIEAIYLERDRRRGIAADFRWLVEEIGELAKALRGDSREQLAAEFADALAWLCTLASLTGISLEQAVTKYADGCPKCGGTPCQCEPEKAL